MVHEHGLRLPSRSVLRADAFYSAARVMDEPTPEFLVRDILFPRSRFSIFGAPETAKSLIALLLAVCVASRRPFLHHDVLQLGSVIYVAAEGGQFIGARLRAICAAHGVTKHDLANLHILRRPIALTDEGAVGQFLEAVRALLTDRPAPILILFDTLTRCLGRAGADENNPRDTAMLADRIDMIVEATGATTGLVAHTGWESKHERGHSNLRGNVETAMLVTKAADGTVTLKCEKANHSEHFSAMHLRIEEHVGAPVVVLPGVKLLATAATATPLLDTDVRALRALATEGAELAYSRWANLSGLPSATLDRCRQRLLRIKLVEQHGPDTRPRYLITSAGRARLSGLEPEP